MDLLVLGALSDISAISTSSPMKTTPSSSLGHQESPVILNNSTPSVLFLDSGVSSGGEHRRQRQISASPNSREVSGILSNAVNNEEEEEEDEEEPSPLSHTEMQRNVGGLPQNAVDGQFGKSLSEQI